MSKCQPSEEETEQLVATAQTEPRPLQDSHLLCSQWMCSFINYNGYQLWDLPLTDKVAIVQRALLDRTTGDRLSSLLSHSFHLVTQCHFDILLVLLIHRQAVDFFSELCCLTVLLTRLHRYAPCTSIIHLYPCGWVPKVLP